MNDAAMDTRTTPTERRHATAGVLHEVSIERAAQEIRWGQQNHVWYREVGPRWQRFDNADEARQAVNAAAQADRLDYAGILTEEFLEALEAGTLADVRAELVQVAAVAVAAIESIDRNGR